MTQYLACIYISLHFFGHIIIIVNIRDGGTCTVYIVKLLPGKYQY